MLKNKIINSFDFNLNLNLNLNQIRFNHFKQLYKLSQKYFPRGSAAPLKPAASATSAASGKEFNNEIPTSKPDYRNIPKTPATKRLLKEKLPSDSENEFSDNDSPTSIEFDSKYEEYFMSRFGKGLMEVPEPIQKQAKKVFSKHPAKDVREWVRKYMLQYSQNHASEEPFNLSKIPYEKIFSNSEELNIEVKLFNEKEREAKVKKETENDKIIEAEEKRLNKPKENISKIKIIYEKAHTVAYLLCKMPYTLNVTKRVMIEISKRMPEFQPNSFLDFGSGLGSGVWASLETYNHCLQKVAAVEPNRNMRRMARFLSVDISKEVLWVDSLTMIPGTGIDRGKFDLINLGYVLQELQTSKQRLMVIEMLWNRLNQNGIMIVIEPGSPKGFRFIHDLRSWVINKTREEACVVAPCAHHLKCPQSEKGWCHFSQMGLKFPKEVFPKIGDKETVNEKFSYLVIKKGKTPNVEFETEEEVEKAWQKSFFWARVIRPVLRRNKHVILDLCTRKGKMERRTITKSHDKIGGYKNAKRVRWGELWYLPEWLPNKFRKEGRKGPRLW